MTGFNKLAPVGSKEIRCELIKLRQLGPFGFSKSLIYYLYFHIPLFVSHVSTSPFNVCRPISDPKLLGADSMQSEFSMLSQDLALHLVFVDTCGFLL